MVYLQSPPLPSVLAISIKKCIKIDCKSCIREFLSSDSNIFPMRGFAVSFIKWITIKHLHFPLLYFHIFSTPDTLEMGIVIEVLNYFGIFMIMIMILESFNT